MMGWQHDHFSMLAIVIPFLGAFGEATALHLHMGM
jgi:hypothetical protein